MNDTVDRAALEALLAFYAASGVDHAVDERPHNRFEEGEHLSPAALMGAPAEQSAQIGRERLKPGPSKTSHSLDQQGSSHPMSTTASRPPPEALSVAADEIARQAGELARNAATIEQLQAALEQFEGCALKRTARQLVFADGVASARVMFVGEAPGADEDRIGKPFVGRSGQLLDRMLAAIGLDRTSIYIANVVPWRPPGNRTPTPQEAAICRPFINRQIELCNPDVLVCLGGPSAQALLGIRDGILKARGRWYDYDTGSRLIRGFATLHPAYLLRSPLQKRLAWRDFRAIRRTLQA